MSCITIAKEIKSIHPEDVALIKLGGFYKVYGKDAYILAKLLGYKIKEEEKIANCGFESAPSRCSISTFFSMVNTIFISGQSSVSSVITSFLDAPQNNAVDPDRFRSSCNSGADRFASSGTAVFPVKSIAM